MSNRDGLNEMINKHAANGMTVGKTYGSIDAGLAVIAYRNERQKHYREQGLNYVECKRMAQIDVINKYGEPVSV